MLKNFGDRLRELRKKAGLNQEQLANLVGVHETTIRRWENKGDKPLLEFISPLAKALGVPEADLLNEQPPDNSGDWILSITVRQKLEEEVIDLAKPIPQISTIVTARDGAYIALGGNYALWADDAGFKAIIAELKKMRAGVLQQGKSHGELKD